MRFGSDFSLEFEKKKIKESAFIVTTYYLSTSSYAVQTFLWSLPMWKASSETFATCVQSQTGHQEVFMHLHLSLISLSLGSQCLCRLHILMSSTLFPLQSPCLEMLFAWPLVLLCGGKEKQNFITSSGQMLISSLYFTVVWVN